MKFAESLGELEFKASDCRLLNWKERSVPFCQILLDLNLNKYTSIRYEFFESGIQVKIRFFCSYF